MEILEKAAMRGTGHGLTQIAPNPAPKCPQGSLPTHDPKHWSITANILEGVHPSESQGCAESPLSIWPPQTGSLEGIWERSWVSRRLRSPGGL